MDLEQIFKNAGPMDAQNITLLLLSLIAQFGSSIKNNKQKPAISPYHGNEINQTNDAVEDSDVILAYNLSTMLVKYYSNDPNLWSAVMTNLEVEEIRRKEEANRRLSPITANVLISIYVLVITFGSLGNLLVMAAFSRKPALRSRRNAFIINLAVSDLLLCLVTMPLTLIELLNDHWPIGDSVLSCKAAGGLQAVCVFVSTITITAIALDRYQLIVYPTKDVLQRFGAAGGIFFIWVLGFCLASPLFIFRTLEHHDLDYIYNNRMENDTGNSNHMDRGRVVHSIDYCYEKWPVTHGRVIYSAFTLLVQYAVPILIISILHTQICQRLRIRQSTVLGSVNSQNFRRQIEERKRLRRQHRLLMAISLVFSITWLPLNVLNLTLDLYNPFKLPRDKEMMFIIYAACHLFGMSSACVNPFLYGWFNENFRNEFKIIFGAPSRFLCPADSVAGDDDHRRRSSASAFTSAADTVSTMGQSIRLRRISSAPSMINTNNTKKNSTINTRGLSQPLTTVKEISETSDDHKHAVETKLLSQSDCSQAEGRIKTESYDDCQAHSLFEMDNTIVMLYPISGSSIVECSSTLETHL